jgi:hypothetical protein
MDEQQRYRSVEEFLLRRAELRAVRGKNGGHILWKMVDSASMSF